MMKYSELKTVLGEINSSLDLVSELSKIIPLEDVVSVTASMRDDLDHLRHVFKHSESSSDRKFIASAIEETKEKLDIYSKYVDRKLSSAFDFDDDNPVNFSQMFLTLNKKVKQAATDTHKIVHIFKKIAQEVHRTVLALQRTVAKDIVSRRGVPIVISLVETNDQFSPWVVYSTMNGAQEVQIYQIPRQEITGTFPFEYSTAGNHTGQRGDEVKTGGVSAVNLMNLAKSFVLNGNLDNEIDFYYIKGFSSERLPTIGHPPWI